MSSRWGVSDFIAISSLTVRVQTTYQDAIHDKGYISDEAAALRVLIDRAAQHFKTTPISSDDDRPYAQNLLIRCQSVLEHLDYFARKYKGLPPTTKRQVILSKKEIVALRESLISNTILLNGFVRSCEYREIQAHLGFILGLHHISSKVSIPSIASFATNTNTEAAYKQFCDDLRQIGVSEDILRLKEDEILDALRSQRMIASCEIGDSDIEDKDEVLETAYQEYCEGLYRIGFTENMILQQKDEILGILRSRGMVTSTNKIEDEDNSSTNALPSFRLSSRVNWSEPSSKAGSAPLHIPAHNCTMRLLLGKGSSTKQHSTTSSETGTTLLHLAAKGGYTGLVEMLLGSTPKDRDRTGVMELLISNDASIDAGDKCNNTPLHFAAKNGHIGVIDLLLSKGASIEAKGLYKRTPLHLAAGGGRTETMKLLLRRGGSIEARLECGCTLLHWVAYLGRTKAVRLLLEKGALINTRDNDNQTPLHAAVGKGHIYMVKLLLEKGASIGVKDRFNETPLDIAERLGKTQIIRLLQKAQVSSSWNILHTHHHA